MWCSSKAHPRRRRAVAITAKATEHWPVRTPLCASCARSARFPPGQAADPGAVERAEAAIAWHLDGKPRRVA